MNETPTDVSKASWQDSAEYGGFYIRLVAMLIDTVILMLPLSLLMTGIFYLVWGSENMGAEQMALLQSAQDNPDITKDVLLQLADAGHFSRWLIENILFSIIGAITVIVIWYYFSGTPGKLLLRLKIVDATTGLPVSGKQNVIRYLGYIVATITLGAGFFAVAFSKRKQGLHDKLANTVVVYKNSLPKYIADKTHYEEIKRKA
ncbi:MAG: RDD family protein [Alphaproteobacteria bacterium]|nr:RDD family protein [Alphaproteobacteria bacterium]